MTLRSYGTRPWLWLAMSVFAFIALGRLDWIDMKGRDALFGISILGSLREVVFGQEPVERMWVLVPWLLGWLVIAGVVGWCLHSAVVVLFSSLENSKPSARYLIVLGAFGVVLVGWLIIREWGSASRISVPDRDSVQEFAYGLIGKLPPQPRRVAYYWYSGTVEGEWPIPVPYNPPNGPWIVLEKAIVGFAKSNGIRILHLYNAGSMDAYVGVRRKDVRAMRMFVRSMGQSANKAGAASPSWPVGSETNRTSAAPAPN